MQPRLCHTDRDMSTHNRQTFVRHFSSGLSCNVEIIPPRPAAPRPEITTQNGSNERERWYDKDGEIEPTIGDFLGERAKELPEHHDIFHEYRDWFVSEIIPTVVKEWSIAVRAHITGWRPHQHQRWDCVPGTKARPNR
jgi:hypothetical protein